MRKQYNYSTLTAYTLKHMYERYLEYTTKNDLFEVDYKTYRSICEEYFQHILDEILYRSMEFKLPCNLGTVFIGKYKAKIVKSINFGETKKLGKVVWNTNEHSDGYNYRFYWKNLPKSLPNIRKYALNLTRYNKRELARLINNKATDYIEI